MTIDEALALQEANPTALSDLASILASWHTLGEEVRRLSALASIAERYDREANAKMLARQCDLAREAETKAMRAERERNAARAEVEAAFRAGYASGDCAMSFCASSMGHANLAWADYQREREGKRTGWADDAPGLRPVETCTITGRFLINEPGKESQR